MERLEKLERDNRRFKRLALAALVLPIALVSIYATRPVPDKITAHEFDVVDSAGRVRIKLKVSTAEDNLSNGSEEISLLGRDGKEYVVLDDFDGGAQGLQFLDDKGNDSLRIGHTWFTDSSSIELFGGPAVGPLGLSPAGPGTQQMLLSLVKGQPTIHLGDQHGFEMDLGSTSEVNAKTGVTDQTSADSIVMFGNDKQHRVIWQAP